MLFLGNATQSPTTSSNVDVAEIDIIAEVNRA